MDQINFDFTKSLLKRVREAGFDEAEVIVDTPVMTELQIDAGEISLMRTTENTDLTLRGIQGGRYATVTLNQTDDESVKHGIAQLVEAAKSAPVDPARAFAPKQPVSSHALGPAEPSLEKMYDRVMGFAKSVEKAYPEVKIEQSAVQFARARHLRVNTQGLETDSTEGYYSGFAMFTSKRGEKMSSFNYGGAYSTDLNKDLLEWGSLKRLIENSVKEIDHAPVNGKIEGTLLITPDCVFDIFGSWLSHLGNQQMIAGTSRLRDKMGQEVASPLLTIRVEPGSREFARREFTTGDGYLAQPSTIVEKGVLKSFMLSDYGARKTGLTRAANDAFNRVIDPGTTSLGEMLGKIKSGLWLGRFSGGNPAANGDFSGTAKNSFLIENGKITKPVSEVMISGNLFDLMKQITAVSKERINDGMTLVPWIATEGIAMNGK